MKEKYIKVKNLSISEELLNFVNNELLPNTKLKKENFWNKFNKIAHDLSTKNKKLLEHMFKITTTL